MRDQESSPHLTAMDRETSEEADDQHNEGSVAGAATEEHEALTGLVGSDQDARGGGRFFGALPPFWRDRFLEGGMILSLGLYCIIGNQNIGSGGLFAVAPLITLPLLLIFAALCWYRPACALALLPLSLPFYRLQKTVYSHYAFSPAEIALWTSLAVVLLQALIWRRRWSFWLSWRELRGRLGVFALPMLVFFLAAALSIAVAYDKTVALRSFREEVLDPLLYVLLALYCLRTRRDLARLLLALFATGFVVALLALAQYFVFKNQPSAPDNPFRVYATYGSANSIGLLFDYVFPVGLALILLPNWRKTGFLGSWGARLLGAALCLPLGIALYLSYSGGAWLAMSCAVIFLLACLVWKRKVLLIAALVLALVAAGGGLLFHQQITNYVFHRHADTQGVGTATKRIYLWQSALEMIKDSPVLGYGMDNWLCHYSLNDVCHTTDLRHYWITTVPGTHQPTGLLKEPDLSHPHDIFLHVWVSMGIFGLLAFVALLVLFFWLLGRILVRLRASPRGDGSLLLQWMALALGAGMVAALVQGLVDSAFLEQDLAFCFWMLVGGLLLLRVLSKTPWRGRLRV